MIMHSINIWKIISVFLLTEMVFEKKKLTYIIILAGRMVHESPSLSSCFPLGQHPPTFNPVKA